MSACGLGPCPQQEALGEGPCCCMEGANGGPEKVLHGCRPREPLTADSGPRRDPRPRLRRPKEPHRGARRGGSERAPGRCGLTAVSPAPGPGGTACLPGQSHNQGPRLRDVSLHWTPGRAAGTGQGRGEGWQREARSREDAELFHEPPSAPAAALGSPNSPSFSGTPRPDPTPGPPAHNSPDPHPPFPEPRRPCSLRLVLAGPQPSCLGLKAAPPKPWGLPRPSAQNRPPLPLPL